MNGTIEQLNQAVRALCVLMLLGAFVLVFVMGAFTGRVIVSVEAFVGVLTFAMMWWFKSRDEQAQREAVKPPPGTVVTSEVKTTTPDTTSTTTTVTGEPLPPPTPPPARMSP